LRSTLKWRLAKKPGEQGSGNGAFLFVTMEKIKHTETVPLEFSHAGEHFTGFAEPLNTNCREEDCYEFNVMLNNEMLGTIYRGHDASWTMRGISNQELVDRIGEEIWLWYGK
jgi:hypothetical protein